MTLVTHTPAANCKHGHRDNGTHSACRFVAQNGHGLYWCNWPMVLMSGYTHTRCLNQAHTDTHVAHAGLVDAYLLWHQICLIKRACCHALWGQDGTTHCHGSAPACKITHSQMPALPLMDYQLSPDIYVFHSIASAVKQWTSTQSVSGRAHSTWHEVQNLWSFMSSKSSYMGIQWGKKDANTKPETLSVDS